MGKLSRRRKNSKSMQRLNKPVVLLKKSQISNKLRFNFPIKERAALQAQQKILKATIPKGALATEIYNLISIECVTEP